MRLRLKTIVWVAVAMALCPSWNAAPGQIAAPAAPNPRRWTPASVAPMPEAVASFGAAYDGSRLWVSGGHVGRTHAHSEKNLTPQTWSFDPAKSAAGWTRGPDGALVQGTALVSTTEGLIRVGGMTAVDRPDRPSHLISVDSVALLCRDRSEWRDLPPLPEGRSSHDAVLWGRKLVVVGGWTLGGEEPVWCETGCVLDLDHMDRGWTPFSQPFGRRAGAAAVLGDRLYLVGGISPDGKVSREVEVLHLPSGEWTAGPSLPSNGFGAGACATAGRVWVSLMDGTVHGLEADGVHWEFAGRSLFGRYFHRMVPLGDDAVALVAGASRLGHWASVEVLVPLTAGTPAEMVSVSVPWSGPKINRQGSYLSGSQLHFMGGNVGAGQHAFEPRDFTDEHWVLDLGTLMARSLKPWGTRRQSSVAVALPGAEARRDGRPIHLLLGGFGHDGTTTRSFDEAFLVTDDTVRSLGGALPRPLTQFGATSYRDHVFVVGGLEYDASRGRADVFAHQDLIYRGAWDPESESLSFTALETRLPEPRRAFGFDRVGPRAYIVGGMTDGFAPVETCWSLNLESGEREPMPAPNAPRISPELVAFPEHLCLVGGSSRVSTGEGGAFAPNPRLELFDLQQQRWHTLVERLPIDVRHVRAFAFRGWLLMASFAEEGSIRLLFVRPVSKPD